MKSPVSAKRVVTSMFTFILLSRYFCRNGVSVVSVVEGAMHRQVVELIKKGGDTLKMTIISVPPRDVQRLDLNHEFFSIPQIYDLLT